MMISKIRKNHKITTKILKKTLYFAQLAVIANFLLFPGFNAYGEVTGDNSNTINDFNSQIEEKNQKIDELQKQIDYYKDNIKTKQNEALTIENEISIVDSQIDKKNYEIQSQEQAIAKLELEIIDLIGKINVKEDEIAASKENLSGTLREMYEYDQKTNLEIAVGNNNFSDFFTQLKYIEKLSSGTKQSLDHLKTLQNSLQTQKETMDDKKKDLVNEKVKLVGEKEELSGVKIYKDQLLYDTNLDENKFQLLVKQVKDEQGQVNNEIAGLENEMRKKLEDSDYAGEGSNIINGNAILTWPVNPQYGISCGFHCSDYPFKTWFEHNAIDIRTPQGTSVRAADSGYIGIAKNAGMGYSYVLIGHGGGLSTVYGHLSRIDVAPDQYVTKGQVIGLSGATPGTPGAGRFTTGPHLHFEVRVDGIPDDPMKYLPSI